MAHVAEKSSNLLIKIKFEIIVFYNDPLPSPQQIIIWRKIRIDKVKLKSQK